MAGSQTATREKDPELLEKIEMLEKLLAEPLPIIITETDIRAKAYYLWQRRGRPEGQADIDWYEAERILYDLRYHSPGT